MVPGACPSDDAALIQASFTTSRARRLAEREFQSSRGPQALLAQANRVTSGERSGPPPTAADAMPRMSLEDALPETPGVKARSTTLTFGHRRHQCVGAQGERACARRLGQASVVNFIALVSVARTAARQIRRRTSIAAVSCAPDLSRAVTRAALVQK
jgi:hypothetical protein